MTESRRAIVACDGTFTYDDLDRASRQVAGALLASTDHDDLPQARVAFLVPPSFASAAVQRGIWRAGGSAVPLAVSHPPAELDDVMRDAGASIVVDETKAAFREGWFRTRDIAVLDHGSSRLLGRTSAAALFSGVD